MEPSLAIAICLFLAGVLGPELRISSAIPEIVAGALLAYFIPEITEFQWLELLASLGLLALMFVAGFDLEIDKLRRTWRSCVTIGAFSFFVPMLGIFAAAYYLVGLAPLAAGLVAIGLSTTSLALVYQALRQENILATDEGQTILAAASVVDLLSMVSLALLLGDFGWGTGVFVLAVGLTLISLPPIGSLFFRRYRGSASEPEIRFLMVVLVGMGFMAEKMAGIHPAVVAFALGVAMSGVVVENARVRDKLTGLVFGFFAPVFFLNAGMQLDVRNLDVSVLTTGALLFVVAVGLKLLASGVPSRLLMPGVSARQIGLLFNYRLSFGIIAAEVGLNSGVLSENVYVVMLLVIAASALLPPLLYGVRRARA